EDRPHPGRLHEHDVLQGGAQGIGVLHGAAAELDDREPIAEPADVAEGFDQGVGFADGIVHRGRFCVSPRPGRRGKPCRWPIWKEKNIVDRGRGVSMARRRMSLAWNWSSKRHHEKKPGGRLPAGSLAESESPYFFTSNSASITSSLPF